MGFFDRFSKPKPTTPAVTSRKAPAVVPEIAVAFGVVGSLSGDGPMEGYVCIPVAGESHYQDALRGLRDALDVLERDGYGFIAVLVPEPTNPHDANAIVVKTPPGETLGYVRADVAKDYQAFLLSLEGPIECSARLTGGTEDRPSIGVVLDFADLKTLRQKIGTSAN